MKKIVITSVLFSLFLVSCGDGNNSKDTQGEISQKQGFFEKLFGGKQEKSQELTSTGQFHVVDIEYDKWKGELNIGGIIVKKGFPEKNPYGITPFGGTETYINSNVPNYFFFVTSAKKSEVVTYYTEALKKASWTLTPSDGESESDRILYSFEKQGQFINMSIYPEPPKNLQALSLTGNFVEVSY